MTPEELARHQACVRKKQFYGRKKARAAAKRATQRIGRKMAFYKCDYCGQYHLYAIDKSERDDRVTAN